MQSPLTGIVPPMITPLLQRNQLDVAGLERLIEHILAGGVSGLFILGTSGEGPSLGYPLRRELIQRTCRQVRDRVPVLVGITDTIFDESVNMAKAAADAGAAAVVVAPPYYLHAAQPELLEYLDHLVPELPLPLYLYNMPSVTKVAFEIETLRRAMDYPRIIGLKDSSCNMFYFHQVLAVLHHRPDWPLLIGPEELLFDAVLAGGHGGVNGGANVFPGLYVKLFEVARAGDVACARQLHSAIMRVSGSLYRIGRHSSAIIKGIKGALNCLGVCEDYMAEPFHRFRGEERKVVQARVAEIQADLAKLDLPSPAAAPRPPRVGAPDQPVA
jgi:4-hydroxy-tetrahydrodipicolinate synthase